MPFFLRVFGVLLFLTGIGGVVYSFFAAAQLFFNPIGEQTDLPAVSQNFAKAFLRALLLLVMALCGSILAGKGVQLYIAAAPRAESK